MSLYLIIPLLPAIKKADQFLDLLILSNLAWFYFALSLTDSGFIINSYYKTVLKGLSNF